MFCCGLALVDFTHTLQGYLIGIRLTTKVDTQCLQKNEQNLLYDFEYIKYIGILNWDWSITITTLTDIYRLK